MFVCQRSEIIIFSPKFPPPRFGLLWVKRGLWSHNLFVIFKWTPSFQESDLVGPLIILTNKRATLEDFAWNQWLSKKTLCGYKIWNASDTVVYLHLKFWRMVLGSYTQEILSEGLDNKTFEKSRKGYSHRYVLSWGSQLAIEIQY